MKRMLSLLLAVAMLLSLPVIPAQAAQTEQEAQVSQTEKVTVVGEVCPCGCGKAAEDVTWKPWTVNDTGAPSDGHYYLTENYAQTKQHTIMAGDRVVIDLRGKTLTSKSYSRLFLVYGYLAVMDTVGGGRLSSKTSGAAYGGTVMVGQNETADPTFAFHSGTMTPDADNKSSLAGGLVTVGSGCHFIMYGGTILGGTTTQQGGAIQGSAANADIQILGGSIIGCKAEGVGGAIYSKGNVTLKNCLLSGNEASGTSKGFGGNICSEGGTLTVENAVIEHGVSKAETNGGGNIFTTSNCTVSIKDSTIRNGYAAANGGNVCFGTGTQTLENVKIYGGVASKMGGNLFESVTSATTTIIGGEIAGDAHYISGKLTLKGAVKIGMNSSGLRLTSGSEVDASGLTAGAEIYVNSSAFDPTYFKPVATGTANGYCPHCKQIVTWAAISGAPSGHCYLTGNVTSGYTITGDTVIDLRGYNITASGRAFGVSAGATLTLLDSIGGATVKGSGVEAESGGVIHNAGTLNIYGGNYIYVAGKTIDYGGVIYTDGNTSIHGGLFDGSAVNNTASEVYGGVLLMSSGAKTFTMTAGRALGGNVNGGSTFSFGGKNTVNITGGSFQGGTASTSGANLRFNSAAGSTGNATIENALISGGSATTSAGTIYLNYFSASMQNCLVMGGQASSYGGSIMLGTRGFLNATDCFIAGGKAPKGGNVYASSYLCGATFTDCTITGGTATSTTGGNIMINHGSISFNGGEISYGTAKTQGGNVYTNGGNYNHNDAKDDGFRLYASEKGMPIITTGTAGTSGGNIYSSGVTVLDAAFINNGSATSGKDIYYYNGATNYSLTVGAGLTGNISFAMPAALLKSSEVSNATGVAFPGKLILEGDYGEPALTVKNGKLMLGGIAVIEADGTVEWVVDMSDALNIVTADSYIKIYENAAVTLTKDCIVDVNGKTLTASGNYTVYGMDSTGDNYTEGTGKIVLTEGAQTAVRTRVADGREYVSIQNGDTATYHRLGMKLTHIVLRAENCGVYYNATWDCDSTLAALVDTYGVTLSVHTIPGENFADDTECLSTNYDGAELVNGEKRTGVLVKNIMKESLTASQNETRGQMPVYAKAYLKMKDGTCLLSDATGYSLQTAMERLDKLISENPTIYRRYTNGARAFTKTWKENGMGNWSFTNLEEPVKDDVVEILMIGSSFCYYYVEELWGLLNEAGIKARVCNVYYSGCKLDMHYNWWINNEAKYQFFVTDENGRRGTNNVSLEYCLAQGDWDFFSLQQSNGPIRRDGPQQHLDDVAVYTDALIPYLQQEFPNAEFLWHQTWANQIGYNRDGYKVTSAEQQDRDTESARQFAILLCEKYDVRRVPSGDAWQIIRHGGYDNLCARLIINNGEGDYYHEGDIGGGQYLNACVWFEVLTGQSCLGNTYAPVYTHNGKTYTLDPAFIETLQNAAHQAVLNMKAE